MPPLPMPVAVRFIAPLSRLNKLHKFTVRIGGTFLSHLRGYLPCRQAGKTPPIPNLAKVFPSPTERLFKINPGHKDSGCHPRRLSAECPPNPEPLSLPYRPGYS